MGTITFPVAVEKWIIDTTLALLELLPPAYYTHFDPKTEASVSGVIWEVWDSGYIHGLISHEEYSFPGKYERAGKKFFYLTIPEFFHYIG